VLHTLPFLIPGYRAALIVAIIASVSAALGAVS